jgi:DNA-binding transcriptional LysR family regulator
LESYFKSKLFVRSRTGIQLTPQGEIVTQYAKEMLRRLQEVHDTIKSMETDVKGTIKLGVSSTVGRYMLPEMLRRYLARYPDVDVNVITGFSSDIERVLEAGDIHIAIIRGKHHWHEQKQLLSTEPICVVSKSPIDVEQLPSFARIYYKTDSSLKDLIDDWWKETFKEPPLNTMEVDNLETCKELVKMGLGYAILPDICLKNEHDLFIQPLHTRDNTPVIRKTWIYCRDRSMSFATVRSFFNFFNSYKIDDGD